ncbi:MAG: RuBisCO large subunit C-terminal-like domain-containing protein, partial [Candidatus Natronoplasma sp.]
MHADVSEELRSKEALLGEMHGLKKMMPVASGGLHPGLVPELMEMSGKNVQIQAGGGVSGHPNGVRAGAKALSQAVDAAFENIDLREYAQEHAELKQALEKWM